MAPKSKKGQAAEKGRGGEEEREDPLQAVILTDSFEARFNPFTLEQPRCLLPLANTPLIEYTFEFLANAGVEEVFVYCGAHTQILESYVQQSRWSSPSSPFLKVEIIRSTSKTVGDAMRHLDSLNILVNDFLVVYGDLVSNLPVEAALAAHRARRAVDKNAMMTMVLREAGPQHRTQDQAAAPVFIVDPSKSRCLHYEEMRHNSSDRFVTIDPEIMTSHSDIEIRTDVIDCGIDICTPDVLALWSDNFDFETPRRGFLYSVLKDYELNGKTIHVHVESSHYAARARDLHAYDSVSKDVVSRWAYPLCPDSNLMRDQTYMMTKGNIYKEQGVILARSCVIDRRTVIGHRTSIGDGSVISNSIIGRRCTIGRNVKVDGAFIWDDASIADGATVSKAIVASESHIGRNCKIEAGALISYQVRVGDGVTVRGSSRLTRMRWDRQMYTEPIKGDSDPNVVGKDGDGFEFYDSEEEEGEEDHLASQIPLVYRIAPLNASAESISTLNSEYELDIEPRDRADDSRTGSFVSTASDDSRDPEGGQGFHHDAVHSIYDSLVKGDDATNIQLELQALRLSTNASQHQVRRAVVQAFVRRVAQLVDNGTRAKDAAEQTFGKYEMLVSRTMFDKASAKKEDQVDFLLLLQQDLANRKEGETILVWTSNQLYDMDVIEQKGFEQWWNDPKSTEGGDMVKVRGKMQQFMDALLDDDDDDDDEDDDDSDEEEEEEEEEDDDD